MNQSAWACWPETGFALLTHTSGARSSPASPKFSIRLERMNSLRVRACPLCNAIDRLERIGGARWGKVDRSRRSMTLHNCPIARHEVLVPRERLRHGRERLRHGRERLRHRAPRAPSLLVALNIDVPERSQMTEFLRHEIVPTDAGTGRIAGTIGDFTHGRETQDALREVQDCFRCSFEQAPIGMMIIDLSGCYERVNDAFCTTGGFGHEQLAGLSSDRITHPEDVVADAATLRAMLAGEATSDTREKRYLHASGRV